MENRTIFHWFEKKYILSLCTCRRLLSLLGSLFELHCCIILKNDARQKALIDEIRCRNGNLGVTLGKAAPWKEEL